MPAWLWTLCMWRANEKRSDLEHGGAQTSGVATPRLHHADHKTDIFQMVIWSLCRNWPVPVLQAGCPSAMIY